MTNVIILLLLVVIAGQFGELATVEGAVAGVPSMEASTPDETATRRDGGSEGTVASLGATDGTIVNVTGGLMQADPDTSSGALAWRGIPFAAPPLAVLGNRWRPPQPVLPWRGVRSGVHFGHSCPQVASNEYRNISEDCLTLNVFRPLHPSSASPMPVMLFFYGGSYVHGSSDYPVYNGEPDVASTADTVIVTSNYRLGVLGYAGAKELRARSPDGSTGK